MTFFQGIILFNVLQIIVEIIWSLKYKKIKKEEEEEFEEVKRILEEEGDL